MYCLQSSGHPLYCPQSLVLSPPVLSAIVPGHHPLYCSQSLGHLLYCPQSLGHPLYCLQSWSSPVLSAVSGHILYCVRSLLVISCTVSAASG
ncbi:unnamed protein product, partial [Staurois parvus]